MHLTLNFFGGFHAAVDDQPISESRTKRIEALLIYLAMEAHRPHRRELLIGLLFPTHARRGGPHQPAPNAQPPAPRHQATPKQTLPFCSPAANPPSSTRSATTRWTCVSFRRGLTGCEAHRGSRDGGCDDVHGIGSNGRFSLQRVVFRRLLFGRQRRLRRMGAGVPAAVSGRGVGRFGRTYPVS